MNLKPLSLADCEQVRHWRNAQPEILRTPYPLTVEQQEQFYREVVCDRRANARYWGVCTDGKVEAYGSHLDKYVADKEILIGMAGIENIQWENRLGEVSLLMAPDKWEHAPEALRLILQEGFLMLNLDNIFTEVYVCNPHYRFWIEQADKYKAKTAILPNRKYWKGLYWNSIYLGFYVTMQKKEDFLQHENTLSQPVPPAS